jgi:hypothetical protein
VLREHDPALVLAVAPDGARDDAAVRVVEPGRGPLRAEDARRQLDDAAERRVEPLGARELAAELEQRLRALGLAPRRLV